MCPTPCDGVSKMNYNFMSDVEFAEKNEAFIRNQINLNPDLRAEKCEKEGWLMIFAHGYHQSAGYLERRKGNIELRPIDF